MYPARRPAPLEGWLDDVWSGVKQAGAGFLKGGVPGATATITGQPMQTASIPDALEQLKQAAVRKVAQRPDVQPILRQEAMKSLAPSLAVAGAIVMWLLLSKRR